MKFYKIGIIFLSLLVLSMGVVCAFEVNYSDLSNKINTTDSTVKLDINYKYNDADKGKEYINIVKRNLTIDGNGKIIDANNKAGLFKITDGSNVVLKNMVIRKVSTHQYFWLTQG